MLTKNIDTMKSEIAAHIKADAVVQHQYWRGGKGCFIGCLTHSNLASKVTDLFGMPEPLVKICEHIFENSNTEDAKKFFSDVPDAIGKDGKDLSRVTWLFLIETLKSLPPQKREVKASIDRVIAGLELVANGETWLDAADAARAAAYATADAAAYAATYAAAYAAAAANATAAAANATAAADAAADAARAAAYAAAEIKRQRVSLLDLIKAA